LCCELYACIAWAVAVAEEDLTARARIRDAALEQFAELGYERTTIRGIAAAAGVSLGLVRHHFGAKQALRDAVDQHVLAEIRQRNDEIRRESETGRFSPAAVDAGGIRPFQRYIARALLDGSTLLAALFDEIVGLTEDWIAAADKHTSHPPYADRRSRAAVFTAMVLGVPLLREHLTRVLGVDPLSPAGERRLSLALLDLYSRTMITRELADAARAALPHPHPGSSP
jgi:TetR/AcrR family transcriptional regulator, regulator of cefoperazone and chloramphenicol sensitivity